MTKIAREASHCAVRPPSSTNSAPVTNADSSEIQEHLDECGPCLQKYDLERTVKSLVQRSCTEHAPETLREKVLLRIREVQVEITETRIDCGSPEATNPRPWWVGGSAVSRHVRRWDACRGSRPSSCGHDACGRSYPWCPPRRR